MGTIIVGPRIGRGPKKKNSIKERHWGEGDAARGGTGMFRIQPDSNRGNETEKKRSVSGRRRKCGKKGEQALAPGSPCSQKGKKSRMTGASKPWTRFEYSGGR